MRWYEGTIAEAVTTSKQKSAIFVVFLEGEDAKSQELKNLISEDEITARLESENFVAIKIKANSTAHIQFRQIYNQAIVPSLFFIGKGKPLEIVKEPTDVAQLSKTIDSVLEKNGYRFVTPTDSSTSLVAHQKEKEQNVVCEGNVCKVVSSEPGSSKQGSTDNEIASDEKEHGNVDEKVEKALKLMEKLRETKEAEEKEKERLKELERRKMGQDVQKLRRWQEDEDMKHIIEEKEKEKREEKAARERILQQIAQDRADRAAKFGNITPSSSPSQVTLQPVRRPAASSNTARLQFKLPDGSSHTRDFQSSDTLATVRSYIALSVHLPFQNYLLSTAFPRREFTSVDDASSLADLELVPNAVILILPLNQGAITTQSNTGFGGLLWSIITPIFNMLGILRTYLFGLPGREPQTLNDRTATKRSSDTGESSRSPPKRRLGEPTPTPGFRQEGNVHRLSDQQDDDDENNTWNGNSTQQM